VVRDSGERRLFGGFLWSFFCGYWCRDGSLAGQRWVVAVVVVGFAVLWEVCFWVKVLGRANDVALDFIPGCFSKVVGCCVGFYVVVWGLCASSRM